MFRMPFIFLKINIFYVPATIYALKFKFSIFWMPFMLWAKHFLSSGCHLCFKINTCLCSGCELCFFFNQYFLCSRCHLYCWIKIFYVLDALYVFFNLFFFLKKRNKKKKKKKCSGLNFYVKINTFYDPDAIYILK